MPPIAEEVFSGVVEEYIRVETILDALMLLGCCQLQSCVKHVHFLLKL